jgi:hypothetical protein
MMLFVLSAVLLISFIVEDSFAEWEKVQIKNEKVNHIHPNMTFNFFYKTNVTEAEFYLSIDNSSFNFKFDDNTNANIELKIPKNYPLSEAAFNYAFLILADQTELDIGSFTSSNCFNEISVIVTDIQHLELITRFIPEATIDDYVSEFVPNHCLPKTIAEYENNPFILSPLKQQQKGVNIGDIQCKFPLKLHIKDGTNPLCIKSKTFEVLVKRGYF